ncbi:MAG TPA: hypothetical protein VKG25_22210 [Bryobacteraceae bacterium]|nr:hypothetical protein [Bryobacteraceae bacterium]
MRKPQALRLRLADHKVEIIASLKDLPCATGPSGNTQISVALDLFNNYCSYSGTG